jgi:hypothetical protein
LDARRSAFGTDNGHRGGKTTVDIRLYLTRLALQFLRRLGSGGIDQVLDQRERLQNEGNLAHGNGPASHGGDDGCTH